MYLSLNVGSWLVRRCPAGFKRVQLGMVIPFPISGMRHVSAYYCTQYGLHFFIFLFFSRSRYLYRFIDSFLGIPMKFGFLLKLPLLIGEVYSLSGVFIDTFSEGMIL